MTDAPIPVVGVGASAGGIDAFHRFFEKMPADSGLAFVVVLHLAPGRRSLLPEILARWTPMPVAEAHDGSAIVANQVLVVPAGVVASLRDGHLYLKDVQREALNAVPAPIDAFFDSLAISLNEEAIGVVLSGTGHDGALGLKAIKARGGLTLAQGVDGSRPEYSGMPDSAVAAGGVDLQVPVEEMPGRIIGARQVRLVTSERPTAAEPDINAIRLAICAILRSRLGHEFGQYKSQTFMRRVQRRMQVLRLADYNDYICRLDADREQVLLLFRDLLISVTSFFRDTSAFAAVEEIIIPRLFKGKDAAGELRIWVPGCATGEEAYSLAILVREYMAGLATMPKVQIFASDIDEIAIGTARAGQFPATLLEGVSPERRARFFTEGASGFIVKPEIREMCTFSAHSLIRDPPFSRMDMISCRNLLIYLDNNLQDQIIPVFHYALVPGGILMLGSSETITRQDHLFDALDRTHRIFVRRDGPSDVPSLYQRLAGEPKSTTGGAVANRSEPKANWVKAVAVANRRIVDQFASPFIVVNASGEIIHFSRHTGRFLEPAPGSPNANLFEMARKGWGLELRAALRRCMETGRPVEQRRDVARQDGEMASSVRLVVEPLPSAEVDPLFMIVFEEVDTQRGSPPGHRLEAEPEANAAIAQLERENRDLREQMQSIAGEHATAVEELRSSNEELQSVNEELQSTNEELETSREEIQSINEELNTVNTQLSGKVEELDRSNGDLKNLFDSTKVATVFLDPFLIIRSFTPEIASIYNLIPSDLGRPLTDIVSRLTYTNLAEDVRSVLKTLQPLETRVERKDGSAHYLMRILPYRSPDSTIDGSLITFVDVTSIVRAEEHQRLLVDELNHRVKNMLTVVISLATNTLRRCDSLETFREVFLGRIHALTTAYSLLSREGWSPISLREILMEELRPFLSGDRENIVMRGDELLLVPRAALTLGMAVHELTTNAVKYGALSVPEGTVTIAWVTQTTQEGHWLEMTWTEHNGPPVTPPTHRGFGTALVERGLSYDLGGEARIAFPPEGVIATLRAPLSPKTAKEA